MKDFWKRQLVPVQKPDALIVHLGVTRWRHGMIIVSSATSRGMNACQLADDVKIIQFNSHSRYTMICTRCIQLYKKLIDDIAEGRL